MAQNENPYWNDQVTDEHPHHTPAGTFTQKAPEIVKALLKDANNDPTLALRRLTFYMNRAGSKLTNKDELSIAKAKLEALEKNK